MKANTTKGSSRARQRTAGKPPVKILLVDDHPLMREGIRLLVESQGDLRVCAEASEPAEALNRADAAQPDAVIADLSLPGAGGLELIRDLQARFPAMPILVVSMHDELLFAERALRAGARGYVMKQDPPARVLEGLRAVLDGRLFVSPDIAETLLTAYVAGVRRTTERVGVQRLSDREIQVFEAIGNGETTRDIATRLHLSVKTVETYRANIKRKLGLENAGNLAHAAFHWVENEAGPRPEARSGADAEETDPRPAPTPRTRHKTRATV